MSKASLDPSHSPEHITRRLLFYRALHESDASGLFINKELLEKAVQAAKRREHASDRLTGMIDVMEQNLVRRHRLEPQQIYGRAKHPALAAAFPLCFLLGLCSNYLGASNQVNILLNPLTALISWNIFIYIALLLPSGLGLGHLADSFSQWIMRKAGERSLLSLPGNEKEVLIKARLRFWKLWLQIGGTVTSARSAVFLHGLAMALTLGVIGGLYFRGLALDYNFVWRSTFIQNPDTAASFLKGLFYPVTLIQGGLPPLEGNNGAAWIHIFALAALLYIILPRLVLAGFSSSMARRRALVLSVDLKDPYFLTLLAPLKGKNRVLEFYSYSYTLPEASLSQLQNLFRTYWGQELGVDPVRKIPWGHDQAPEPQNPNAIRVICFNGAQTPEEEVHDVFCEQMDNQEIWTLMAVDMSGLEPEDGMGKALLWQSVLNRPLLIFRNSQPEQDLLSQLKEIAVEAPF